MQILKQKLSIIVIQPNYSNSYSPFQDSFFNPITQNNHIKSKHSNERSHPCEYCPNKYATAMLNYM